MKHSSIKACIYGALLGLFAVIPFIPTDANAIAAEITGRASVIDGDTLDIHGKRIRLFGIDAPESSQLCQNSSGRDYRCGQQASLALADKIGSAPVTCATKDVDRYGRTVAVCRQNGVDLNEWLVSRGHAVAYARYSTDYVANEGQAKAEKRGIWGGAFTIPSEWRKANKESGARQNNARPAAPAITSTGTAGCQIKGNINAKGERIYHLPGRKSWEKTRINEADGERWFCNEAEAQAAGWRAPRGGN